MNKYFFGLIGILVLVVFVSGCTNQQMQKNYSGNVYSFKYPDSWNLTDNDPSNIFIKDPNNEKTFIRISNYGPNTNKSGKAIINDSLASPLPAIFPLSRNIISENNISINGLNAYEVTFTSKADDGTDMKGIVVVTDVPPGSEFNYVITCFTTAQAFEQQKTNFNTIINSFQLNK